MLLVGLPRPSHWRLFACSRRGILRVALKGKANQNARMTIQYGFILAVVLSVLGSV